MLFLPFDSIEKEIFKKSNNTQYNLPYVGKLKGKPEKRNKKYFDKLTKRNGFDMEKIFDIAEKDNQEAVLSFENRLSSFLKM